jgi:hypothetical protein
MTTELYTPANVGSQSTSYLTVPAPAIGYARREEPEAAPTSIRATELAATYKEIQSLPVTSIFNIDADDLEEL